MSFESSLEFVLKWEGGYVFHPADKGGPTNKGITQKVYDTARGLAGKPTRSVAHITDQEVAHIYKKLYWDKINGDYFAESLSLVLFDFAVHSGPMRAVRFMQKCLKVNADGLLGPITLQAVKNTSNILELANCIITRREEWLRRIGKGTQAVFVTGWLNRIAALRREV